MGGGGSGGHSPHYGLKAPDTKNWVPPPKGRGDEGRPKMVTHGSSLSPRLCPPSTLQSWGAGRCFPSASRPARGGRGGLGLRPAFCAASPARDASSARRCPGPAGARMAGSPEFPKTDVAVVGALPEPPSRNPAAPPLDLDYKSTRHSSVSNSQPRNKG